MYKLLSANLRRLKINSLFYIFTAVVFGFTLWFVAKGRILVFGDFMMAEGAMVLASIAPAGLNTLFVSFFLGREYSDKTIRNKIAVGHSKNEIYAASLITISISTAIWVIVWLIAGILGAVISGAEIAVGSLLTKAVIVLLYNLAFSSALTSLCMVIPSRALSIVIHTQIPPLILTYVMVNGSNIVQSGDMTTLKNRVIRFFVNATPMGQWFFSSDDFGEILYSDYVLMLLSLAVIVLFTAIGIYVFRAKELK